MSKLLKEKIFKMDQIAPKIFRMRILSEHISKNAKPGQFVNIKCCDGINALLRRPISICSVDREQSIVDIIFQVKGIGTEYLSKLSEDSYVDIIGPLGKPFHMPNLSDNIAIIGGGIGVFPLLFLLKECEATSKKAFLGFRNFENVVLEKDFKEHSDKLSISTDDGSYGEKGIVTKLLIEELNNDKIDIIYACGPNVMIKSVSEITKEKMIKCQVSLEQRMACGIGACLACACKIRVDKDEWEYKHVCKDGPVFWSDEVIW